MSEGLEKASRGRSGNWKEKPIGEDISLDQKEKSSALIGGVGDIVPATDDDDTVLVDITLKDVSPEIESSIWSLDPEKNETERTPFAAATINALHHAGLEVGDPFEKNGVWIVPISDGTVNTELTNNGAVKMLRELARQQETEQRSLRAKEMEIVAIKNEIGKREAMQEEALARDVQSTPGDAVNDASYGDLDLSERKAALRKRLLAHKQMEGAEFTEYSVDVPSEAKNSVDEKRIRFVGKALEEYYGVSLLEDGNFELARKDTGTKLYPTFTQALKLLSKRSENKKVNTEKPKIEVVEDIPNEGGESRSVKNNTPTLPKRKLTREEMQAYLAEQKVKNTIESGSGEPPIPPKPHLNNAESIAYLKSVQEMREQKRMGLEQKNEKSSEPSLEDPRIQRELDRASLKAQRQLRNLNLQILNRERTEEESRRKEERVDIELPLEGKKQPIKDVDINLSTLEAPKRESTPSGRSVADIQNEIAYLEKVKSEISYSSKEFSEKYPEFKAVYGREGFLGKIRGGNDAAAFMWMEKKLAELKSHKKESASTAENFFDERFEKNFGITKAELMSIPGFERLSSGQQEIVFTDLKEYAERGDSGYLASVWTGIKSVLGNKGEGIPKQGSKGMEAYGETLRMLVYRADKFGPKVHVENGVVMPDLVGLHLTRENRKEQKEAVDALNSAAHLFARVPASWQEDGNGVHAKDEWKITTLLKETVFRTETRKHYREYEVKQNAYEAAKKKFAVVLEAVDVPRDQIVRKLIEIDAQVYKIRFLETNPEAVEALQSIKDEDMWKKVGSVMAQGSLYAGMGAVGRAASAQALGFLSGPLVSASLSGTRRWNTAAAEQRERDRKARMGVMDKDSTALNIVSAKQQIETHEGKRDMGLTAKLERLVAEYRALPDTTPQHERVELFNRVKTRVVYSYDKLKLNRIQFGSKDEFAVNQAKFFETLAEAHVIIAVEEKMPIGGLEVKLNQYMKYREGALNNRRHMKQVKKVALASTLAAGASVAGVLAVEEFKTGNVAEKLKGAKEWFTWNTTDTNLAQEATTETTSTAVKERIEGLAPFTVQQSEALDASGTRANEEFVPLKTSALKEVSLPEVTPNVEASPTSPTAAEKASIQELFKEALAQKEGSAPKSPPVFADARNPSIVPSSPTSAERASMQELFRQNSPTQVGEIETGRKEVSAPKGPPVFDGARNPNTIPSSPTNAERASIQRLFNEDQKYPQIKGRSSAEVIAEVLRNSPGPNGEPPVGNKWVRFPEGVSHKAIQEELLRTAHENDIRGGATKTGEVQGLSKEDLSTRSMSESITSHDRQQSRILEKYFLNTNVPFQSWTKVRYLPVNSFIADTMERGAGGRHPQALVQLGKVFDEVRNPPYGIIPGDNETTMSYISRAFDAISHAENTGQNTEKIRNFLRNVKGVR